MSAASNQADVRIVFKSETQQHRFNAPYQTGSHHVWPTRAYSTTHVVAHNDIVVMASDGLFDNLYPEDISKLIK